MNKNYVIFLWYFFSIQLNSQSWQLIWEDNFDGNSIDATNGPTIMVLALSLACGDGVVRRIQGYQAQNTTINNGIATIEVKEEPSGLVGLLEQYFIILLLKLLQGVYLILDMVKLRHV